jgi:hypothetical protein
MGPEVPIEPVDGLAAQATALTVTASDAKMATALRTANRISPTPVRIEISNLRKPTDAPSGAPGIWDGRE